MRWALPLAAVLVPTIMLVTAVVVDNRASGCFDDWSSSQQAVYNDLVIAAPFVAAILGAWAVGSTRLKWGCLWAGLVGAGSFAFFGIASLVVAFSEGC